MWPTLGNSILFRTWELKQWCWVSSSSDLGTQPLHFSSVQLLSHVWLFATLWTAACQASLSIANSRSLLKLISVESVMPSNNLLCPRGFPGKSTRVGCYFLLQGIFLTQGLNHVFCTGKQVLYHWATITISNQDKLAVFLLLQQEKRVTRKRKWNGQKMRWGPDIIPKIYCNLALISSDSTKTVEKQNSYQDGWWAQFEEFTANRWDTFLQKKAHFT